VVRRASSAGHAIVHGIRPPGWLSGRYLAHDLNDVPNDITAGATSRTFEQIANRGSDLGFGVIPVYKIPIELV
jgi:hypothetical protein